MANEENLIPLNKRSQQRKKEIAAMGGKARAKNIQRKKYLSQVYGEMLADKYEIEIEEGKKHLSPEKFFKYVVTKILKEGGSPAVQMLREIADKTEGFAPAGDDEVDTIVFDRGDAAE